MIELFGRRVLLKVVQDEATPGGIIIPGTAEKLQFIGKVVARGMSMQEFINAAVDQDISEEQFKTFTTPSMIDSLCFDVEVGDTVFFERYSGQPVKITGKDYILIDERNIIGRLSTEASIVDGKPL